MLTNALVDPKDMEKQQQNLSKDVNVKTFIGKQQYSFLDSVLLNTKTV